MYFNYFLSAALCRMNDANYKSVLFYCPQVSVNQNCVTHSPTLWVSLCTLERENKRKLYFIINQHDKIKYIFTACDSNCFVVPIIFLKQSNVL